MGIEYSTFVELTKNEYAFQHIDDLKEIYEEQQKYQYSLNPPCKDRFLTYTYKGYIDEFLGSDDAVIFIAQDEGKIIGFLTVMVFNKDASIEDVFIKEEYRHRGIGSQLMRKAIDWIRKVNATDINVHVVVGNEKAIDFYKKFGLCHEGYTLRTKVYSFN